MEKLQHLPLWNQGTAASVPSWNAQRGSPHMLSALSPADDGHRSVRGRRGAGAAARAVSPHCHCGLCSRAPATGRAVPREAGLGCKEKLIWKSPDAWDTAGSPSAEARERNAAAPAPPLRAAPPRHVAEGRAQRPLGPELPVRCSPAMLLRCPRAARHAGDPRAAFLSAPGAAVAAEGTADGGRSHPPAAGASGATGGSPRLGGLR